MSVDRFGRTITDHGDGTYSVPGITIGATNLNAAIGTFDSMAPPDWVAPIVAEPLDEVGALATLLVVVGTLDIDDAANAVRLTPADLVAEAEAWKVAADHP